MLGRGGAVDRVVGGHHRPGAPVADDDLEGGQVQLAQGPLADPDVDREPVGLGVVGHEVLHGGGHSPGLHPAHIGDADAGRQQRVLAEALEVAPPIGGAVQVDGRGEQHVHALAAGLGGQQPAQPLHADLVPAGRQCGRGRDVGGGVPLVPQLAPHPGRAVGQHHPTQPDRRLRVQGPEVGPGQQPCLCFQRQRSQPLPKDRLELLHYLLNPAVSPLRSWRRPRT